MHQWHTVGRAIPGGLRPRRARFCFARRANRSKTTSEEQEQSSAAVANGLAPRSIHLTPGGPLLLADVGPFWLPITTSFLLGRATLPSPPLRSTLQASPRLRTRLSQPRVRLVPTLDHTRLHSTGPIAYALLP